MPAHLAYSHMSLDFLTPLASPEFELQSQQPAAASIETASAAPCRDLGVCKIDGNTKSGKLSIIAGKCGSGRHGDKLSQSYLTLHMRYVKAERKSRALLSSFEEALASVQSIGRHKRCLQIRWWFLICFSVKVCKGM